MGGACSKKKKQDVVVLAEPLQGPNDNETAAPASILKNHFEEDNEELPPAEENPESELNDEDEYPSSKNSGPKAKRPAVKFRDQPLQRDPTEQESPSSSRLPNGRSGPSAPSKFGAKGPTEPSENSSIHSSDTAIKTRNASKTPTTKTGRIQSFDKNKPKTLETDVSYAHLDYDPYRQGPTVIELADRSTESRSIDRERRNSSIDSGQRPATLPRRSSRVPGQKLKTRMMERLNSLKDENRSRSRPPPSNHDRNTRRRWNSSNQRSDSNASSIPSHRVGNNISQSKDEANREPFSERPRSSVQARIEFENRNIRIVRDVWRDYEKNNNLDQCDNNCNYSTTDNGTNVSLQLSNEAMGRILDNMCLKN